MVVVAAMTAAAAVTAAVAVAVVAAVAEIMVVAVATIVSVVVGACISSRGVLLAGCWHAGGWHLGLLACFFHFHGSKYSSTACYRSRHGETEHCTN